MLTCLIRGAGDIGSAIAHRLLQAGHAVVIHETRQPTTTRRGMAFADAVFDGETSLDGVKATRIDSLDAIVSTLSRGAAVVVALQDFAAVLGSISPNVLIDARMRKRDRPEAQRGLAPITIGLGPNFVAGETTDLVVETSWEELGRVVTRGGALPLRGEPREIAGYARDRYVYAPVAGTLRTACMIGQTVKAGDLVAQIEATPLAAPLDGVLRGLTRDGVPVLMGTKVIEIDPRGDSAVVRGIGERPARIADGVVLAIEAAMGRT